MQGKTNISDTIVRFAKARERAYRASSGLTAAQLKAITRIKAVGEYFSTVSDSNQLKAITQLEDELRLILPSAVSRFKKQRQVILELIDLSHD
jgi:5-formyltetrahydrofolate cyclo-ligase